jgi:hypothetical protein
MSKEKLEYAATQSLIEQPGKPAGQRPFAFLAFPTADGSIDEPRVPRIGSAFAKADCRISALGRAE